MSQYTAKALFITYLLLSIGGALLLMLPAAHHGELSFLEAFFTSTSAISITGLSVKNTATDFTTLGQFIIMLLIQIGGLGYMSLTSLLAMIVSKNLHFKAQMVLRDSMDYPTLDGVFQYAKNIFLYVIALEAAAAVVLSVAFSPHMSTNDAIWNGIFHSVSAFNNAGFSIYNGDFGDFKTDIFINFTICFLIIVGGLGFFVIHEVRDMRNKRFKHLSTHTKVVLTTTAVLLVVTFFLFTTFEWHNQYTIGGMNVFDKISTSIFTTVNYRTAGFNMIDFNDAKDSTLYFSSLIMIIGGAPGGTAGGIKVTAIAVLTIAAFLTMRGEDKAYVFNREIGQDKLNKAFGVLVVACLYVTVSAIIIAEGEDKEFLRILFEIVSAYANVGLSTGNGDGLSLSADFNGLDQSIIIILMLMGRIGVVAFTLTLLGNTKNKRYNYPKARIIV